MVREKLSTVISFLEILVLVVPKISSCVAWTFDQQIVSLLLGGLLHQFVDSILEKISTYNLDSSSTDLFGGRSPRFSIHLC